MPRREMGEVCITAIEMSARVTLRFELLKSPIPEPQLRANGPLNEATGKAHDYGRGPFEATGQTARILNQVENSSVRP